MKKLLLSVLLLSGFICFSATNAHAQLGIKAGFNSANFNDTDASLDSRSGFTAGLTYDFGIPMSPITIQPGVFYAQKGAKFSGEGAETTTRLDYIEIPVVAKFDFILDNPMLTPHVFFGPYMGFNINAEQEGSAGETSGSADISDEVKGTDFGVVVGAGADITKFNVGVRYSAGLSNAFEEGDGKNGVFSIVAGINF
ncbi:porin family protein [Fodinibius salsisoli]|uniref:PorT family protein n=1 Tax=Fodinibius salsisoli TaxID=2820877 RepID=A0ABT3PRM7_9BACT|nr:porin family protein [Fodinibius salsisoli]MCW9708501.1 PorT family protein [Fodinibius salsisoli]